VASYLPPFTQVLDQFAVGGLFARPRLAGTERALLHMFDDAVMLSRTNPKTKAAAAKFKRSMQAFSAEVSGRTFDADGLSQGMPFVWKALDPNVAPYSITT
jgi:arachidonate 15-lipoxygenase (second type)/8-lipoxygenase (S-type)